MGGTIGQALGGHRASRIWAWRACKALGFVIFGLGFVISRLGFVILRLGFAISTLGFADLRLESFEGKRCELNFLKDFNLFSGAQISRSEL